ncbi:TonB-dependent heme/hemoglobin receptor ChuA/ShuA, partial [Escherichia coli]
MSRPQFTSLRLSLLALAVSATLPTFAFATETMTVTATGNARSSFEAPMMVSVIDTSAPENQTATSATDLLRHVPGITLDGTGRTNGQDVNMRGYDHRGVLVLVDGVRQGTDTGHLNGTFLDPALIKRVEIVRGPSALLYGSGALGGVISYDTVDAKDLLQEGQSSGFRVFGTGGTGDHSLGLGASAFGRTENLDGIVAWSSRDRGDLRQSNGETAPNDESINNMLAKGTWQIDSAQSLSGLVRYYNNDAREPKNPQTVEASDSSNPMVDRSTIQRDAQLSYKLAPQGNDWLNADAKIYWSEVRINAQNTGSSGEYREQ